MRLGMAKLHTSPAGFLVHGLSAQNLVFFDTSDEGTLVLTGGEERSAHYCSACQTVVLMAPEPPSYSVDPQTGIVTERPDPA